MKKTVELLISERGDFWMETVHINEDETLRDVLHKLGYVAFHVQGVNPDDTRAIRDGMTVRVHIFSGNRSQ